MPSGLTQDGISTNAPSRAAQQAATLTSSLAPFKRSYRIAEDIQQGFVFVIGKFPCIHKTAVLIASLVFKMLLLGIIELFHGFPAAQTLDVPDSILGLAHFRITAVGEFGHPVTFQLFRFTIVEPQAAAALAFVDYNLTVQGFNLEFLHRGIALRAVHFCSPSQRSLFRIAPKRERSPIQPALLAAMVRGDHVTRLASAKPSPFQALRATRIICHCFT